MASSGFPGRRSRRPSDDHREVSPRALAVAAVREEVRLVATRAAGHVVDVRVVEALPAELRAHGATEIDVALRVGPPRDDAFVTCGLGDLRGNLVAHLEAARSDARSYRRELGPGPKPFGDAERGREDAGDHAAPPGVRGGDDAAPGIGEQDGHAVGDADAHGVSRRGRDECVPLEMREGLALALGGQRDTAVDLGDLAEARRVEPEEEPQHVQVRGALGVPGVEIERPRGEPVAEVGGT